MRATVAALLLLSASALPVAAHAETLDVMTVTGNGQTYVFDFPSLETFTYPLGIPQFIPGLTPVSETLDGASVTPTELYFHPGGENIIGPFGTIMYLNVLDVLSYTGPYNDPDGPGEYDIYTSTFDLGTWDVYDTGLSGNGYTIMPYTVSIEEETVTDTPEPSALLLLATALLATIALRRRMASA